ncbi:hypothetical protein [Streptomyces sp. 5-10]|uniref:hypothetical protein n=1 Tax=Streptomyces sp. 5-10 TaxID=878925 RepID=UPI00168ADAFC|nr:hypothetical protein [Streptomyces sp. 5-10]MBD3004561.1 hypothetical protein [Streptomyces sp. 5-10]
MVFELTNGNQVRVRSSGAIEFHAGGKVFRTKKTNYVTALRFVQNKMWGAEVRFSRPL